VHRVVVTGLGVIAPVGRNPSEFFDGLIAARSGIRPVASETIPQPHSLVAGQIDFDPSRYFLAHQAAQLDRATQFALAAASDAIVDASLELTEQQALRTGVYWGTGLGGATSIEESYRNFFVGNGRVRPTAVVMGMNNAAAGQISITYGFRGPVLNLSTACSSSASAIGEAYRAIRGGYADVIVAGGSEALVTLGNLMAWDAMRAIAHADPFDPSRSCKPFSANRVGLVLGEGAGALVLERSDWAVRRGSHIYAEIVGYGNTSDAFNISKPDSAGQVRAMRLALAEAELMPDEIDYVNAHGTATQIGDVVETNALKEVFAERSRPWVSSTKALHGHLMGASGAVEMVASVMALEHGIVPPTAHLDVSDPSCDLDYVPNEARSRELRAVMSNSFGFGGMNAVLIARRLPRIVR
jgi:3-oxoacyl-[acyl-carrier-protein] synthase II